MSNHDKILDKFEQRVYARSSGQNRKSSSMREDQILYRTRKYNTEKWGRHMVQVNIGSKVIKKLDWVIGDKAKILANKEHPNQLAVVKDNDKGYTLMPMTVPPETTYSKLKGSQVSAKFSGRIYDDTIIPRVYDGHVVISDYKIENGAVFFTVNDFSKFTDVVKNDKGQ